MIKYNDKICMYDIQSYIHILYLRLKNFNLTLFLEPSDPPGKPFIIDSDRHFIKFQWDAPANDYGAPVQGYYIERKDARVGSWSRLNETMITVSWIDIKSHENKFLFIHRLKFVPGIYFIEL